MDWRRAWTFPNTLVGIAVRSLFGRTNFIDKGFGHYEASPGSPFDRAMRRMNKAAITLGDQVLYVAGAMTQDRVYHELEHVSQARKWGPLFFPAYGVASLWALIRHGSLYRENTFERKARRVVEKSQD